MGLRVRNGTPLHNEPLCETCVNAQIERGFSESEEIVFCSATWPSHRVRFRVRQCSGYLETKRQSLKQMEDMAWVLMPRGSKRKAGFVAGTNPEAREPEVELILTEPETD